MMHGTMSLQKKKTPYIPFGPCPFCAHFLFTLPSNPLQTRQSIFPAIFLFSLLLPLELSLFISHSSLVHPFIMSILSYFERLYKLYFVCCLQYNPSFLIWSYFIFFFSFHATWIFLTIFLFEYSNSIQSSDVIVPTAAAWNWIFLTWELWLLNLMFCFGYLTFVNPCIVIQLRK